MNKFFKNRDGISLIVLIITIIIIIILAASIILSITKNNPITNANKAVVQSDFKTFESELSLYIGDEFLNTSGEFNSLLLYADSSSITYAGTKDTTKNISDIITSLTSTYSSFVEIAGGKIVLTSSAPENTATWANEILPATTTCELKDAPDSIKKAWGLVDTNTQVSPYGGGTGVMTEDHRYISNGISPKATYSVSNIVYTPQDSDASIYKLKKGYYKLTQYFNVGGQYYWDSEALGESFQITY